MPQPNVTQGFQLGQVNDAGHSSVPCVHAVQSLAGQCEAGCDEHLSEPDTTHALGTRQSLYTPSDACIGSVSLKVCRGNPRVMYLGEMMCIHIGAAVIRVKPGSGYSPKRVS